MEKRPVGMAFEGTVRDQLFSGHHMVVRDNGEEVLAITPARPRLRRVVRVGDRVRMQLMLDDTAPARILEIIDADAAHLTPGEGHDG